MVPAGLRFRRPLMNSSPTHGHQAFLFFSAAAGPPLCSPRGHPFVRSFFSSFSNAVIAQAEQFEGQHHSFYRVLEGFFLSWRGMDGLLAVPIGNVEEFSRRACSGRSSSLFLYNGISYIKSCKAFSCRHSISLFRFRIEGFWWKTHIRLWTGVHRSGLLLQANPAE